MRKLHLSKIVSSAILATGLSAGLNSSAYAAQEAAYNPHGVGDVLLYPYYSTKNNFASLFHLVNTSDAHTVLAKVRFREYQNSEDVLDFSVIMSPSDVFTGYLRQGDASLEFVKTDNTCTSPQGADFKQGLISFDLAAATAGGETTMADLLARSHTGHIEVITMGTIQNDLVTDDIVAAFETFVDDLSDAVANDSGRTVREVMNISTADGDLRAAMRNLGPGFLGVPAVNLTVARLNRFKDALANAQVANKVAMGALHNDAGVPGDCGTVDNYFRADDGTTDDANIVQLQAALTPSVSGGFAGGVVADGGTGETVNALSGHFAMLRTGTDESGGFAAGSRPIAIQNATVDITNSCGGTENNLVCGQFVEHYPVPNMANLNGVDATAAGVAATNVTSFVALEQAINLGTSLNASISNEWSVQDVHGGATEITVTLPLKHVYNDTTVASVGPANATRSTADVFAGGDVDVNGVVSDWNDVDLALRDDDPMFIDGPTNAGCVNVEYSLWDREELHVDPVVGSTSASGPSTPGAGDNTRLVVCNETTVYTFLSKGITQTVNADAALASNITIDADDLGEFTENTGWFSVDILQENLSQVNQPVANTGFAFWSRTFGTSANNYGQIIDNIRH